MAILRSLILALDSPVKTTLCNGKSYTFQELSGYGFVPSNFRDKYDDTLSLGSSIAIERSSWKKLGEGSYEGTLWLLPDRGWNTQGTTAYQPRIHKFKISLDTNLPRVPSPPNLKFTYLDTILFSDPAGNPTSGLDPTTSLPFDGFPNLPAAKFTGDGFGGEGPGGTRVSLDPEGLVLDTLSSDGGFWVSDEYGPFIYRFNRNGKLTQAIKPPAAFIPIRKEAENFASNNPPIYDPARSPDPVNPTSGRSNNQGFEGLTVSGDGRNLYALLQSAAVQEGGPNKLTNRYARMVKYDITVSGKARLAREYVVPLPQFNDPTKKTNPRTAGQSEILAVGSDQFLILSRDSDFGHGLDGSLSNYRQIDVFDISDATSLNGRTYDSRGSSITTAPDSGILKSDIKPALYCPFLDINDAAQLAKFGLHNGGAQDAALLNEKWESLAIVPVDGKIGDDDWWFVITISDNDFITQNGTFNFGKNTFKDASGYDLDSQALVYKIKLPEHSRPFVRGQD
ncbi:outer membrane autotransporter [Tuber magnatum]|uniref:Outer membrane autotransporter n=1 Tax=Tuber magnatum TaxID=42249 RepID=A0A317SLX8_9PEZI|nr:outer membrane autotransporter [Tuber magnatum]